MPVLWLYFFFTVRQLCATMMTLYHLTKHILRMAWVIRERDASCVFRLPLHTMWLGRPIWLGRPYGCERTKRNDRTFLIAAIICTGRRMYFIYLLTSHCVAFATHTHRSIASCPLHWVTARAQQNILATELRSFFIRILIRRSVCGVFFCQQLHRTHFFFARENWRLKFTNFNGLREYLDEKCPIPCHGVWR